MPQTRRALLGAFGAGTLPLPVGAQIMPGLTDGGLMARLRKLQAGTPASNTRAQLALSRTVERLGDLGVDLAVGRVVVVNIAAAELVAYDNGREALRSRVVVGAEKTRTPQLATFVTSLRTNPPWYVPASIEAEVRAAGAVGFRTINGRLVQPPGPSNPLGPLRIGLFDSNGIFLHGTSSPAAFSRASRAVSHGCVRVERIRDVAAWMLDLAPAAVGATLASGRTLELMPPQEVQVVLGYLTASVDSAGQLALHGDPYGFDAPRARRASFRRVARPVVPAPTEPATEDDPL